MIPLSPDNLNEPIRWYAVKLWFKSIFSVLLNLDFGQFSFTLSKYYPGNISGQMINANFAAANVEQAFTHTLNRIPQGYLVFQKNISCDVYQMYNTGTAWTKTNIYLKSTQISNVLIFVF